MSRARELANKLLTISKETDGEFKKLSRALSQYDTMQDDLLHKIELDSFNACDGYKLASQLKQIRQQRREIKQDMSILSSINNSIANMPKNVIDTIKRVDNEFSNGYKPKLLKY